MFRYQFNPDAKIYKGIEQDPVGITVPDMSIGIAQLLDNHSRGLGIANAERRGQYFEDLEIPILQDLNDIAEYKSTFRQRVAEVDAQIRKEIQEKKAKAAAERKSALNAKKTVDDSKESDKGSEDSGE